MARKSKKAVMSYGTVIPQTYGVAGDAVNQYVTFGIGTLDKIIKCSDTSIGLIAFGYNSELKTGAIAVGGELVSSKILDISTNATAEKPKPSVVTVKYLDSSQIKEFTFNTIDPSVIEAIDSSLSNLYQEVINNEEVITQYLSYADVSINLLFDNVEDINSDIDDIQEQLQNISSSVGSINVQAIDSSAVVVNHVGSNFYIGLVVDDNTVKIENGKLKAQSNTYAIKTLSSPSAGALKTYQLYVTDAAGTETAVPNSIIDIPKDYVVKEVHLCKATYDATENEYTETAVKGDPDFDQAAGDLYLHMIWQTKDSSAAVSNTYIKVTDLAPIYTGDADDTNSSINKYITVNDSHVIRLDASKYYTDLIEPIDSSLANLYQELEDTEETIVNYLVIIDNSVNLNTEAIENLQTSIEDNYIQDVSASKTASNLNLINEYEYFDYVTNSSTTVNAQELTDTSVTYTISKKINGVDTVVTTITTIDSSFISALTDLLTEHDKSINVIESQLSWRLM